MTHLLLIIISGLTLGSWLHSQGLYGHFFVSEPTTVHTVAHATPEPTPTPVRIGSIVTPVFAGDAPSEKEIVMGKKNGPILWKVYQLESSSGKNDGCRKDGKFNGFGFGQNKHVWNCFDFFEEVVFKVDMWFESQLAMRSLPEALCYYNTGVASSDCPYYRKYLSL